MFGEDRPIRAAVIFLISRIVTFAAAVGVAQASSRSMIQVLSRWDGGWYLSVARSGYPTTVAAGRGAQAQSSIAFFPGYPLVVRLVSRATGTSLEIAGIAVSMVAGLGAAVALWYLARRLVDRECADRTVVLFSFLPSAFVLTMTYSDGLFLFLVLVCLLALLRERWVVAGLAASAGGFVRPAGVVLVVVCGAAAFVAIHRDRAWGSLAAPLLAPLGLFAYLAYLAVHTHDPRAFFEVEDRGWNTRFDFGAANLHRVVSNVAAGRVTFFVALLGVVVVGAVFGLWLLVRWRPPIAIVVYVVGIVALAVLVSTPASVPRFLLAAAPLLIPISRRLPRWAFATVAATSGVLMIALFFVTGLSETMSP